MWNEKQMFTVFGIEKVPADRGFQLGIADGTFRKQQLGRTLPGLSPVSQRDWKL